MYLKTIKLINVTGETVDHCKMVYYLIVMVYFICVTVFEFEFLYLKGQCTLINMRTRSNM